MLTTILESIDRSKYHLGLFVFHDTYSLNIPKDIEIFSAHVPQAPPDTRLAAVIMMNLRKLLAFTKVVRQFRPDVALSVAGTNIALILTRFIANRSFKVVLSEHSMPSSTLAEIHSWPIKFMTTFLTRTTYQRAELIITPAELVREELKTLFRVMHEKILVIRNPVDVEKIQTASEESASFPLLPDNSFRVGYIGSLSPEKDVATLLRGFSLLRNKDSRAFLFLVGAGRERAALEDLARELGIKEAVYFMGFQKNPYAFLKNFDVFVLPSRYEVFPNVIMEALACGVPIISSAWRGSEWIYTEGKNCLFFPVGDHEKLAGALARLISNGELQKELAKNGQEMVRQCHASLIMEQYDAAITAALDNHTAVVNK